MTASLGRWASEPTAFVRAHRDRAAAARDRRRRARPARPPGEAERAAHHDDRADDDRSPARRPRRAAHGDSRLALGGADHLEGRRPRRGRPRGAAADDLGQRRLRRRSAGSRSRPTTTSTRARRLVDRASRPAHRHRHRLGRERRSAPRRAAVLPDPALGPVPELRPAARARDRRVPEQPVRRDRGPGRRARREGPLRRRGARARREPA